MTDLRPLGRTMVVFRREVAGAGKKKTKEKMLKDVTNTPYSRPNKPKPTSWTGPSLNFGPNIEQNLPKWANFEKTRGVASSASMGRSCGAPSTSLDSAECRSGTTKPPYLLKSNFSHNNLENPSVPPNQSDGSEEEGLEQKETKDDVHEANRVGSNGGVQTCASPLNQQSYHVSRRKCVVLELPRCEQLSVPKGDEGNDEGLQNKADYLVGAKSEWIGS